MDHQTVFKLSGGPNFYLKRCINTLNQVMLLNLYTDQVLVVIGL